MKHILITIMLLSSVNLFGQIRNFKDIPKDILEQLDKMGVDNSPLLNSYESAYFNVIFKDSLKGFDFTGKKVGFIYSGAKSNKQEYFKLEKDRFNRNYTPNNGTLYIFNAEQKAESGGYDAAIVYWSKFLVPIEKVVKRLKEKR
ncbi:hypothetical protein AGMMS50239_16150 [Bacteroidia bacterium]|nr:hypothetical protein AGMMS50239_16150 [Bacteroidia bacterium]